MRAFLGWMVLTVTLALAGPASAGTVRGITVSTHGNGMDWGWDPIGPTLDELHDLGANWVAFHPYAWIAPDGEVRFELDPADPPAHVVRPIREAHARGLRILIKPHLGYWGSGFSWRGDITFETDEEWERFFRTYTDWILAMAEACHDADAFAVGTELDRTLHFADRWREIIRAVRAHTDATLTYAANWTDYRRVDFWDDLDWIGIQAYFPLADGPDPDEATLRAGWTQALEEVHALARTVERPVVFTEMGYNRSFHAAARPWEYGTDGPAAESVQARCLRVALEVVEADPVVQGSFLWKWFPIPRQVGRNFQLATPGMRAVIQGSWR